MRRHVCQRDGSGMILIDLVTNSPRVGLGFFNQKAARSDCVTKMIEKAVRGAQGT